MAQQKRLTWSELRVGIFVLVGLFILAIAVFYVSGGGVLGPKYRLTTYLPEVDGLQTGAPVALDGVEVGNVETIGLTPQPQDKDHSITLVLRIDKKYQNDIRTDSSASLVTQGLLGDRYVTVTRGLTGTPLPPNATIPGEEEAAMKQIVERGAGLMENLGTLTDDLRGIVVEIHNGNGTLGKLMNDPALYNHLDATVNKLDAMASSIQQGQGTLGKLVASDELYTKADSAIGKADDVLGAVRDQKGTLGKLVYDPGTYDSIKGVADKSNAILGDVRAGRGTLGKLATDDSLFVNVRDASANVRDATAKLNANTGTAGKFFTDPQLYDNLTGVTGDMRMLISDFRKNPKQYLHIKLGLF
jgi:phospholipid/cholesterol/gamma-HCH transport system substrate-binding protein